MYVNNFFFLFKCNVILALVLFILLKVISFSSLKQVFACLNTICHYYVVLTVN